VDDDDDIDDLGNMTAATALDENRVASIAKLTGLSRATVKRRLEETPRQGRGLHGRGARVCKVFAPEWERVQSEKVVTRAPTHSAVEGPTDGAQAPKFQGQGRDEHRRLQAAIAQIGRILGFDVSTDKQLETLFKPDVGWFREGLPRHLFEIEFGSHGARAKSVQCLTTAHERWGSKIVIVVPCASVDSTRKMVAPSMDPELKIITIEECLNSQGDLSQLAQKLGLRIGSRR
jgi:hypothetical protein